MEYITSRGFTLPKTADGFADSLWFNLWRYKLWPYKELIVGDALYWYESPSRRIVWKSRLAEVDRFPYESKEALQSRLEARFGPFDTAQSYFVDAAEEGYCLAYKATPLDRLSLPKPDDIRFPQPGWLQVDDDIASSWLGQPEAADNLTLDEVVPSGSLRERIEGLNVAMTRVSPERVRSVVERTVRRDTQMVQALKQLCGFRCQFPRCGVRIPKRDGGFYIEVAHIEPVSEGGSSIIGNLLVLCPNHHKEFDYGKLEVAEQTTDALRGTLNGKEFEIRLPGAGVIPESG